MIPVRPSSSVQYSPTVSGEVSSSYIGTPWVTYSIGLTAVLLSLMAALSLVLILKHIQTKRRERNKGNLISTYAQ